jgi:hypothetical protein
MPYPSSVAAWVSDLAAASLGGDSPQVVWFPGSRPTLVLLGWPGLSAAPARTLVVHFHEHLSATH